MNNKYKMLRIMAREYPKSIGFHYYDRAHPFTD